MAQKDIVKSVEFVETTVPSTTAVASGTLTKGQDIRNCVPFVTNHGNSTYQRRHYANVWFEEDAVGSGYIHYQRSDVDANSYYKAYVVEFNPEKVKVYQGELPTSISEGATEAVTLSGTFDSAHSAFVFYSIVPSAHTSWSYYNIRGSVLTSSGTYGNQLEFYRARSDADTVIGHYYMFESLDDDFKVTHNLTSLAGVTGSSWTGMDYFDRDNTFLLGSYASDNTSDDTYNQTARAYTYYEDEVHFNRGSSSGNIYFNLQLVEFTNTSGTIHTPKSVNWHNLSSGTTEKTKYIPHKVDLNYAAVVPVMRQNVSYNSSSARDADEVFHSIWLSSDNAYTMYRNDSGNETKGCYHIVDWKGIDPRDYGLPASGTLASGISPVKSIERLSFDWDEFEETQSLSLGQDPSNCVVFNSAHYIATGNYDRPHRMHTRARLFGDDVVVSRGVDSYTIGSSVEVVEFWPDQIKVQQGHFVIVDGAYSTTISGIDPVVLDKSVLVFSYYTTPTTNDQQQHMVRGRFVDESNIIFERYSAGTNTHPLRGYYYIMEDLKDYWEVTNYKSDTTDSTTAWHPKYSTHYRQYNTFFLISNSTSCPGDDVGYSLIRAYFHTPNGPMRIERYSNSYSAQPAGQIIRFLDDSKRFVENHHFYLTGTNTQDINNYTSDFYGYEDWLSAISSSNNGTARTDNTNSSAISPSFWSVTLDTTAAQVTGERSNDYSCTGYLTAFVLNWAGAPIPPEDKTYVKAGSFIRSIEKFTYAGTNRRRVWSLTKGQDSSQCVPFIAMTTGEIQGGDPEKYVGSVIVYKEVNRVFYEHFWGGDDYGGIDVEITMLEYEPDQVHVQHDKTWVPSGTSTMAVSIDEVNTDKAYIMVYVLAQDSVSDDWGACLVSARFNSSTEIELYRALTTGNILVSWYVVECLQDQWSVEHLQYSGSTNATTVDLNLSEPNTNHGRVLVLGSYAHTTPTDDIGYWAYRMWYDSNGEGIYRVRMNRYSTSYYLYRANIQVITFSEDSGVHIEQRYYSMTGTTSSTDIPYSYSVDTNRSMVLSNGLAPFATRVDNTNSSSVKEGFIKGAFIDSNNVRYSREGQYSCSAYGYGTVIEWPMPTHELGITVSEGASFVPRDVRIHRTDTGEVLGTLTTSGTETLEDPMKFYTTYSGSVYAVCFDDEAGRSYNGLIYTDVYPTLVSGTFPYEEGWVS